MNYTEGVRPEDQNPLLRDPFFRRFFGLPDRQQSPQQLAAGSGVIVDAKNGYVLTNHHVVKDARALQESWRLINSQDIPALNQVLKGARLPAIALK